MAILRLYEPTYRRAWDRGRVRLKLALRQKQIRLAMARVTTMLIWLGKQLLGQADEPVAGPDLALIRH